MKPFLSVVVLARSDRRHIAPTLTAIRRALAHRHASYEILVADAGATDETMAIAARMAAVFPELRVIQTIADAHGSVRAFIDADDAAGADGFGELTTSRIGSILPYFEQGFHVVTSRPRGWFRRPLLEAISAHAVDAMLPYIGGGIRDFRAEAPARARAAGLRTKNLPEGI
ncbi:MAG: glycosyltransferase family 2 protein [Candidatus Liptonbacteria bacterium]|nr:glycosyltransferase family 2 protein [Candidatus Liptonbacteria bacterium]